MSEHRVDLTSSYELSEVMGYICALRIVSRIARTDYKDLKLDTCSPDIPPTSNDSGRRLFMRHLAARTLPAYIEQSQGWLRSELCRPPIVAAGLTTPHGSLAVAYLGAQDSPRAADFLAHLEIGADRLLPAFAPHEPTINHLVDYYAPAYRPLLRRDLLNAPDIVRDAQHRTAVWAIDPAVLETTFTDLDLPS